MFKWKTFILRRIVFVILHLSDFCCWTLSAPYNEIRYEIGKSENVRVEQQEVIETDLPSNVHSSTDHKRFISKKTIHQSFTSIHNSSDTRAWNILLYPNCRTLQECGLIPLPTFPINKCSWETGTMSLHTRHPPFSIQCNTGCSNDGQDYCETLISTLF